LISSGWSRIQLPNLNSQTTPGPANSEITVFSSSSVKRSVGWDLGPAHGAQSACVGPASDEQFLEVLCRGPRQVAIPGLQHIQEFGFLRIEDQRGHLRLIHVELVDQPLIGLPPEVPQPDLPLDRRAGSSARYYPMVLDEGVSIRMKVANKSV
jgi:hypothetical protein